MSQSLSFTELYAALDPKSIHNAHKSKPLCENIFDVPRSDLFETYNRLRQAFWSNEPSIDTTNLPSNTLTTKPTLSTNNTTIPTIIEQKISTPASPSLSLKRQPSDLEIIPSEVPFYTNNKRRRIDRTVSPKLQQQKELFGSAKIPSLYTLWGIKRIIIKQLRCSLQNYNETKMIHIIKVCDQQCNQEQKQHLKRYIDPILSSTRRQCLSLEEALKRWE